jgi:hypothetical protein
MKIRKATSLTALSSFTVLVLTSVILYIVPHGRVAYWADWHLWGLTKTQWGNIHINLGLLLLLAISLHIYLNWKVIISYFKDRTKQFRVFTKEFTIALVFTMLFVAGTLIEIPPFIWVVEISESIKDSAAEKYGEPPYGHAERSSLKTLASRMGFDVAKSVEGLRAAGVTFKSAEQTIQEIAKQNKMSPQQVFLAMKPLSTVGKHKKLPLSPPPGLGRRSLADICQEYNLNIPTILRVLTDKNIKAEAEMTIKNIAEQNSISPIDVYEVIKETSEALSQST